MRSARRSKALAGLVVAMLTAGLLAPAPAPAAPAPPAGQPAGSGTLEGTEAVEEWDWSGQGVCIRATKIIYAVGGIGTYHGLTADGSPVVYKAELGPGQTMYGDAPIRVEIENPQNYYYGPYGTHGMTDGSCTAATAGTPVPAQVRIFAAGHIYRLDGGAQAPCRGTGTFARGEANQTLPPTTHKFYAEWTLSEDCTVVGNAAGVPGTGVSSARTAVTHSGVHEPCFSGACVDNIRVDFHQYVPYKGLHVSMNGPSSATIASPATVNAAVTNDGVPVPDAPVTFSVAGPTPAQPPSGAAVTGADGRASFTFTSATTGDYTVTATVTTSSSSTTTSTTGATTTVPPTTVVTTTVPSTTLPSTSLPSTTVPASSTASGTFVVRFGPPAPPALTLHGPTRAQTEDNVAVTATFTNAGTPIPGTSVSFTVSGPGEATPASGSALTDANGKAAFSFAANRAGTYTVDAAASMAGQSASATRAMPLDIKSFSLAGSIPVHSDNPVVRTASLISPTGEYAYFAGPDSSDLTNNTSRLEKLDLRTFQVVAQLPTPGETFTSGVVDPAGRYAYLGENDSVVKIDLATFERVGAITLQAGEVNLGAAVMDPGGAYAYFGTAQSSMPGRVVKIDLANFTRVGAITLAPGERGVESALMDPAGRYAYFGADGEGSSPGSVVKIDLTSFSRVGAATMAGGNERRLPSAIVDRTGEFGYFGTFDGHVIKVNLISLQRVGAIMIERTNLMAAVVDPAGRYGYFAATHRGLQPGDAVPPKVVKVDLESFEALYAVSAPSDDFGNLATGVIDPAGSFAYFKKTNGTGNTPVTSPTKLYKYAISRPPVPWLVAGNDAYSTPYATPLSVPAPGVLANDTDTGDGDALGANLVTDAGHGTVTLNRNGSVTYTPDAGFNGTDTFTYKVDDGMNVSAPATVTITVAAAPNGVQAVSGSAFAFRTNVGLFGGAPSVRGGPGSACGQSGQPACADGQSPAVSLPANGGQLSATDPDGNVGQYGPAFIFENHGPLTVSASGSTGPTGSVTASATVDKVEDNDPFAAASPDGRVSSTCTAGLSGMVGSSRIVNGRLVTSTHPTTGEPVTAVTLPHTWDPAPNTTYEGSLDHVSDRWRIVFNEQILGPDSITVNAMHMYLLGTTAVGDMIIGQSHCAITQAAANTAPVANADSFTATSGRALTIPAPGVLANDTDPENQALRAATLAPTPPPSTGGGTWTFPSDPDHGTLGLGADGSFLYTPEAGFTGTDTFTYTAQDSRGRSSSPATVTVAVEAAKALAVADFDGDADTDRSVFRAGAWYAEGQAPTFFGTAGDIAVPGDYDGDGDLDRAVYQGGAWYVEGQPTVWHGAADDVPVPGDYDGDGDTDRAVFRPSVGAWLIEGQPTVHLGGPGDVPVPGDYDGDGDTDAAVWRPAGGAWHVNGQPTQWLGLDGDVPVPGDYDGDGTTDRAVWRPASGGWYVDGQTTQWLGLGGDVPVPGDYDADATTDRAVWRPSSGGWHVDGKPTVYLGANGDQPLPLPAAIRRAMV